MISHFPFISKQALFERHVIDQFPGVIELEVRERLGFKVSEKRPTIGGLIEGLIL
jgi:hypothetical protein